MVDVVPVSARFGVAAVRRNSVRGSHVIGAFARGREDVCAHLVTRSEGPVRVEGLQGSLRQGEGVLVREAVRIYADSADIVSVFVPTNVLTDLDHTLVGPIALHSALADPIAQFAAKVSGADAEEIGSFAVYFTERLLQEMVLCLAVEAQRRRQLRPGGDAYRAAQSIIAAQCTDPELRAENIARDVMVSLRQLQRLFSAHGTTIDREVRRARVSYAIELLSDPGYASLSVGQIAQYSGYSSRASLARAMAAESRGAPTTYRAENVRARTD